MVILNESVTVQTLLSGSDSPYIELLGAWSGGVPVGYRLQTHPFIAPPDTQPNTAFQLFYSVSGVQKRAGLIVMDGGNGNAHGSVALGQDALSKWNGQQFLGDTAIGHQALQNDVGGGAGASNTAVGYAAMQFNQYGQSNCAYGVFSLINNISGWFNTAYGELSLMMNTGSENTGVGRCALYGNTSGSDNTAIGYQAANVVIGNRNTAVGANAIGRMLSGDGNIALGNYAGYRDANGSNHLWIWNQTTPDLASDLTHALVYGVMDSQPQNQSITFNAVEKLTQFLDLSQATDITLSGAVGIGGSSNVNIKYNAGNLGHHLLSVNGVTYVDLGLALVLLQKQVRLSNQGAYTSGDRYLVVDSQGNVHLSTQGPNS